MASFDDVRVEGAQLAYAMAHRRGAQPLGQLAFDEPAQLGRVNFVGLHSPEGWCKVQLPPVAAVFRGTMGSLPALDPRCRQGVEVRLLVELLRMPCAIFEP